MANFADIGYGREILEFSKMSSYKSYSLLDKINSPKDVKQLSIQELPTLCEEIRGFLLESLSKVPGHLGANFGVVEFTVALHYVFDLPNDEIVWDVGHQSYVHKILTGRRKDFGNLRQWGGISGFTHPNESEYDSFVSGHASNAISAALGIAVGSKLQNLNKSVIAVIGDGAMTGGLAFEGLNNASSQPNDLLIVLNDNHIGIDPITGGLSKYLVKVSTSKVYNDIRHKGYQGLKRLKLIDERRKRNLTRFNNSLKALINDDKNLFEGFSIRYFGPTDGHDVVELVSTLRSIKDFEGPKLLHIKTVKGKGYAPAEESAVVWHAPGLFDPVTGKLKVTPELPDSPLKYQEIFGKTLLELAELDPKVVGVTPAMISGSSFNFMQERYPNRVFDVGIAEGHAVTFSAGLARKGMIPFCNIYSSFLQRGYDQVIHDVAMQAAPVILCLDRAGLVGEDGMTHHGVYDIAYLRTVPGLTIMSPIDESELRLMMYTAYKHHSEGPFVIRFPRGKGTCGDWHVPFEELPLGKSQVLREGEKVVFVSYGPIGSTVATAIDGLKSEGYNPGHINLRFVKPLDGEILQRIACEYQHIITIEDGSIAGGVGSALLEYYSDHHLSIPLTRIGVSDHFVKQGAVSLQHAYEGMDAESIINKAKEVYRTL
ncbi:1-deoxy-D-xylulose-5-phosphate synthase [Porphyromonas levii]|nr:1-deoxy-D-xylulose-5-phosphate synthase [Porphyromonas levii]MBR8713281.1 1-deoxy-D-xylulose-5-phosphate synthase [Porphyromonas levii]MBR8715309.1 1-deoxy-D-xylulose-5-phosphate synthase [Porphyromonas levii]MBR8727835.1 1-deoxy-D-xylulose-5-phosphate synthase [Porphyromonas levii]MBR8729460.1 1-deoxy-D-xylulose-5-phosphate synthase [Porphyromonas levii]